MMTSNLSSPQQYQPSTIQNSLLSTFNPQQTQNNQPQRNLIWGTTILINEASRKCKSFIRLFSTNHLVNYNENDPIIKIYSHLLEQAIQSGHTHIDIDLHHIRQYDTELYQWAIEYPSEIIPIFDQQITQIANDEFNHTASPIKCRLYNADSVPLRHVPPSVIEHLIQIQGFVVRVGELTPDLYKACFKCSDCGFLMDQIVEKMHLTTPNRCSACQSKLIVLDHVLSQYVGKQLIRLQEAPESIPAGQTPVSVLCSVYYEHLNVMQPGDRVIVTGILRNIANRQSTRKRSYSRTTKTVVEVVHVRHDDSKIAKEVDLQLNNSDVLQIKQIAKRGDVYELLTRSLAPAIFDLDNAKKGVLLQLVGGVCQDATKTRGDIHILLVGDPGVSKSQLLKQVQDIAPRSIYTSGKGSSAVGLTASVIRDPDTNAFVLESGALVMSDGGICCLDEFDKASNMARAILHEVMEQQTVSIAKAGIVTSLRAKTAILAAANPIHSRFDTSLSVPQNINLAPSLLSRFDLVYVMLDNSTERTDARLAKRLASLCICKEDEKIVEQQLIPKELLTKYISYAKGLEPVLSEEAVAAVSRCFVEMRNLGRKYGSSNGSGNNTVTATMRQMMSMMRLAEAHCKLHLRETVGVEDVEEGYRLIKEALQQSATDPKTGRINLALLNTGYTAVQGDEDHLKTALLAYMEAYNVRSWGYYDLYKVFKENKELSRNEFDVVLHQLDVDQQIHWDRSSQLIRLLRD